MFCVVLKAELGIEKFLQTGDQSPCQGISWGFGFSWSIQVWLLQAVQFSDQSNSYIRE